MATYGEMMAKAKELHAAGRSDDAKRLANIALKSKQEAPKADMSFMGRVKDNVIGVDDGIMSPGEKLGTAIGMAGEGATFGLGGDEVNAFLASRVNGKSYDEMLDFYRGNERQLSEENPLIAAGSTIGGALLVPGGVAKTGATLAGKAALGAGAGAAAGATYGFMEGEGGLDNRVNAAKTGAVVGGLLGGAAPVAGNAVANTVDKLRGGRAVRRAAAAAPSRDALEAQASALFESTKKAQLPRQAFAGQVAKATADATEAGMDDMLTPLASRVARNMDDAAQQPNPNISMRELNTLRRQAGVAAGDVTNRPQKALGTQLIKAVDDFVDAQAPALGAQGKEARRMWSQLRKIDDMDKLFERAGEAASGFENGLKSEFRRILKSDKLKRGYSQAELAAMREVTNPGVLAGIVRQVGRLGVSLDNGSNALGGALGAVTGGATMGPAGAVVAPLVGTAARKGSEVITQRSANRVMDVMRAPNTQVPVLSDAARGLLDESLFRAARGTALPLAQ